MSLPRDVDMDREALEVIGGGPLALGVVAFQFVDETALVSRREGFGFSGPLEAFKGSRSNSRDAGRTAEKKEANEDVI